MNIKTILKKTLPIAIAILVIILIGVLILALSKEKENPSISKNLANEVYLNYNDGTITVSNGEVYEKLKKNYGLSALVDLIDTDILADYIAAADANDVKQRIEKSMFSATINEYIENNKLEDLYNEDNDGYATLNEFVQAKFDELKESFIRKMLASYGVNVAADDVSYEYSTADTEWKFAAKEGTALYNYYKLVVARFNYSRELVEEQYKEEKTAYDKWVADGKNGTAPTLTVSESTFEDDYNAENVDGYWAIVIPYSTQAEAEMALLQQGIIIKSITPAATGTAKYLWFNVGVDNKSGSVSDEYSTYSKDGHIITDSAYYKTLVDGEASEDAATGAKLLGEEDIKAAIINLYNSYYGKVKLSAIPTGDALTDKESDLYYTESELTTMGLFSTTTSNKFNNFTTYEEMVASDKGFAAVYSENITSSNTKIYLILAKENVKQWADLTDTEKAAYMTEEKISEELDDATTNTVINTKLAALRLEKGLIIYDKDVEADYIDSFTSDYKKTKKSSKDVVAKCNGKEYKADDLFNDLEGKYGAAVGIEEYQYAWMFLECKNPDTDALFNKYVDYKAYMNGEELEKCVYTKDKEVKEIWENIVGKNGTINNIKTAFASGSYASYGFDASYGWKNFLRDFFGTYYGIVVNGTDDLALYLLYEEVVGDFCEYIATATDESWKGVYEANYVTTLNEYINATGYHLLFQVNGEDGKYLDPADWSETETAKVDEFYGKVLAILKTISNDDNKKAFLTELTSAYASCAKPVVNLDGSLSYPQYYYDATEEGAEQKGKFDYDYEYIVDSKSFGKLEHISEYKAMNIALVNEDLTTNPGEMVASFEEGVRSIWNANLDELLISEDGSLKKVEIHDEAISTEYGKHLYVNTELSLATYFAADGDATKLITMPSMIHALMYQYEQNKSSETGYKSFATLYANYLEDGKTDAIYAVKAKMGLDCTDAEFLEAVTKYCSGTEASKVTNNAYVQSQITTWYTTVYSEFAGSYYYQLQVLNYAIENAKAGKFGSEQSAKLLELLEYYRDSYYSYLAYNTNNEKQFDNLVKALKMNVQLAAKTGDNTQINDAYAYLEKLYNSLDAEVKTKKEADYTAANANKPAAN